MLRHAICGTQALHVFLEGGMPLYALGGYLKHAGKIQPDICLNGCVGTALGAGDAVDEAVNAVRGTEGQCAGNGLRSRDHDREGKVKLDNDLQMPATITDACQATYNVRIHFAYIWAFDLLDDISRFGYVGER